MGNQTWTNLTDESETWRRLASTKDTIPRICAGVTSLAIHPDDAEASYAGTARFGVIRSTDRGRNWLVTIR